MQSLFKTAPHQSNIVLAAVSVALQLEAAATVTGN
jgi:hypothetical protein